MNDTKYITNRCMEAKILAAENERKPCTFEFVEYWDEVQYKKLELHVLPGIHVETVVADGNVVCSLHYGSTVGKSKRSEKLKVQYSDLTSYIEVSHEWAHYMMNDINAILAAHQYMPRNHCVLVKI